MLRTLRAAYLIALVDLRRRIRSRSFLLQAVIGPIVLSVLISLAFGGGFGDSFNIRVGVVIADDSGLAQGLRERLLAEEGSGVRFTELPSVAEAEDAVTDERLGAALVLPAGFEASLATDSPLPVQLITDEEHAPINAAVSRAIAQGFAARVNAGRLATFALLDAGRPAPSAEDLASRALPVTLDQRSAGAEVSPAASVGPGIGLLFLFLSVAVVARTLFEERRLRVLDRMRAAPVSMGAILLGKALGVIVLGCASMGVLWAATSVLLDANWGDPVAVVALIFGSSLAVAGIAAVVAGLVRTERTADLYATMVAFVLGILGGSLVPLSELPEGFKRLSLLTPNGWALRGFAETSAGDGHLVDVLPHVGVLSLWALVGGAIGLALLPKRLGAG